MTAHTPGPWQADAHVPRGSGDAEYRIHAGRYLVAIVNDIDQDETEANAQLIAAAPETAAERDRLKEINAEMLEALRWILPLAESYLRKAPTDPDNAKLETARAIIAKAEGRTP